MTEQEIIDQTLSAQIDDYLSWNVENIPALNLMHFIDQFWLIPLDGTDINIVKKKYNEAAHRTSDRSLLIL